MTCNAIVATSLQIARRDHPCVSGEPERSGTRTTTTRRPAPGAASTSSGAGPIGARRSTVQPAASEMPVTGDALRNAQPLDADQRCCADVFSVVTCSGRSARRPGSVRRLAVSRHIGRVGGPLGDDDRPFEDFDHRAGLRGPGPQPRAARVFTPTVRPIGSRPADCCVRRFQRYRDSTGQRPHGIGARWREVKLDQRSLLMLRPAALISCSRIANLETCWNGRTRLHDQ